MTRQDDATRDLELRIAELERAQAELAEARLELRRREAQLRQVIDLVPHMIFAKDWDGRFLLVNEAQAEAYGMSVEELMRLRHGDVHAEPAELAHMLADDREVMRTGRPKHIPEETFVDAAGVRRVLQTIKIPYIVSGADERAVLGVAVDITERKRQETLLHALVEGTASVTGERFFRSLVRQLASSLDVRWAFLSEAFDDSFERLRLLAAWEGDRFGEVFDYDVDGTPCAEVVGGVPCFYARGVVERFPRDHVLAKMGAQSYLGVPVKGASGAVLGHLCVLDARPMTENPGVLAVMQLFAARAGAEIERERSEQALRESEEHTRRVVDSALDAVITMDEQGVVSGWNPQAEVTFGWSTGEALGARLSELALPDDGLAGRGLLELVESGAASVLNRRVEVAARRKDGRSLPVELAITTFKKGAQRHFSVFVRDISARVRAEKERRQMEEEIQRAQKLESLVVLAGGISHDFNNLLQGILGNVGVVLADTPHESKQRTHLEDVARAARRAGELCDELLAYSGQGDFVIEPIDLGALVADMARLLRVSVSKHCALECSASSELPAIEGDATQLRQVIMNLITNASEAIGDRQGTIRLTTGVLELAERRAAEGSVLAPGRYVSLEVADDGCGMSADVAARIFEPFFTTKFAGRGLGLAALQGIVRRHRGAIEVESTLGVGTRFRLLFPALSALAPAPRRPRKRAGRRRTGGCVLLVDDEELVRVSSQAMLERLGYRVLTAADGREAVELFGARADEVTCVLLDLVMPNMDGERTLHELRRLRPDVRVIVASGYSREKARASLGEGAPTAFLKKPYDEAELEEKLRSVLGEG